MRFWGEGLVLLRIWFWLRKESLFWFCGNLNWNWEGEEKAWEWIGKWKIKKEKIGGRNWKNQNEIFFEWI